jgi:hypothetical protein
MTIQKPMSRIYQKISNAGFNQAFINKLLPEWWDERLAGNLSLSSMPACI